MVNHQTYNDDNIVNVAEICQKEPIITYNPYTFIRRMHINQKFNLKIERNKTKN